MRSENGRRSFVRGASALAIGGVLLGCEDHERGAIITPGEDLMTEHGVLRRVHVVWSEVLPLLREGGAIDVTALSDSVALVQWFIERYHERVEEEHVFPRLETAGRERGLVRVLRDQHQVGRDLTQQLSSLLAGPIDEDARHRIAEGFALHMRMYAAHASREDTVLFPALRALVGPAWAELGESFEENEEATIGEGGLERAIHEVAHIETAFGLDSLEVFTPRRVAGSLARAQ